MGFPEDRFAFVILEADAVEALAAEIVRARCKVALFPAAQTTMFFDERVELDTASLVVGFFASMKNFPEWLGAYDVRTVLRAFGCFGETLAAVVDFEVEALFRCDRDEFKPNARRRFENLERAENGNSPALPFRDDDFDSLKRPRLGPPDRRSNACMIKSSMPDVSTLEKGL